MLELLLNMMNWQGKRNTFCTVHFTILLIGIEMLMDFGFSCPCFPGFNAILISFIFFAPVVFALTVMMFIQRPCKQKSIGSLTLSNIVDVVLPLLVPPLLWVLFLLFDGEYIACGMTHWEGDYLLDEEIQMKWCKPTKLNSTGVKGSDLRDQIEHIVYYSQLSALALLLVICTAVMAAIVYRDCTERSKEATQLSEIHRDSEGQMQHQLDNI